MTIPQEPAMGVSELLPCPFCGFVLTSFQQTSKVPDNWAVRCEVCGAQCGPSASNTAAKWNWNLRAALPHMQPAGEAVAKKHDTSLGPCQWPDCGHDTNQSDSTPGCLGAFCDATRKQATPPQPSADAGDGERLAYVLSRIPVTELEDWLGVSIGDYMEVPTIDEHRAAIDAAIAAQREAGEG